MFNSKEIDILAIGDVVIDAFIKLKDAHIHNKIDDVASELCVRFGDKIPYESVEVLPAVGNSPNAAVAASRLGLRSALIVTVGDDQNGKDCIAALENDHVSTKYIHVDTNFPTNYHYVLWYDVERTILVKHAPFTYTPIEDVQPPKWIYLSSMGEHALDYQHSVAKYLIAHPEIKLAFQPGTFQIKVGVAVLKDIYERSEIFCSNVEEAQSILGSNESDHKKLMEQMSLLGPKNVIMTDGYNGAYAREANGTCWFMPVFPHTPFERTGAGDAFASTIVSCLAMGKSLSDALLWAPVNAMSVTQHVGAQKGLLTPEKIEEYLTKAPPNYSPQKLN